MVYDAKTEQQIVDLTSLKIGQVDRVNVQIEKPVRWGVANENFMVGGTKLR